MHHPQSATPAPGASQAIPFASLELALAAAKLRRYNKGRTAQMAAIPPMPVLGVDCSKRTRCRESWRERALKAGRSNCTVTLMDRGHIGELIERVQLLGGPNEVRKTWGTGVRALLAEPRHLLNGGAR
jgi:hypothetical protein